MAGQKKEENKLTAWKFVKIVFSIITIGFSILMLVIFAFIFFGAISLFIPTEHIITGNVALIPITGTITTTGQDLVGKAVSSEDIVKFIMEADKSDKIKAIILEINSPGGEPVASDEIASAVKKANKTTVAVIREKGTSGAYWIASAADHIIANRMSVTGSIGARASYLEIAKLLEDYNVTYRRLVSAKYKDTGSPFRELLPEEQALFQNVLDKLHNEFVSAVAKNRNLPEWVVRELATGFIFLGSEAKELGLVDELGGRDEAIRYIEQTLGIKAELVEFKKKKTIFETFGEFSAKNYFSLGQGLGAKLLEETSPSLS